MTEKSKHEGDERRFVILAQAWYGDVTTRDRKNGEDEITMGYYCPEGGTSGEFTIKWRELNGRMVPRLQAFDDSWSALAGFADVIEGLRKLDDTNPTVEQVAEVLLACGVKDDTPRESPYKPAGDDVRALATLLTIHLDAFEGIRQLGRDLSDDPDWAAGFEHNQGVLTGTKLVPRPVVDELVRAMSMADVYRTKLKTMLNECKDPEVVAQFKSLAYPAQT